MISTTEKPRVERVTEPAKQWRNKWWTDKAVWDTRGETCGPGEFWGHDIFPSKDIAESDAIPKLIRNKARGAHEGVKIEYLGAHAVSQ